MQKLTMVLATNIDGAIGMNNGLPWPHCKADMLHFKKVTQGKPVIMGRKTYWSLPEKFRPLPGRKNIVVSTRTDNLGDYPEGVIVAPNVQAAIVAARATNQPEACVIGGTTLYDQMAHVVDEIWLTVFPDRYEYDAALKPATMQHMERCFEVKWRHIEKECTFLRLERAKREEWSISREAGRYNVATGEGQSVG